MGKSFNGNIYPFLDMDFDGNLIIKYYDENCTFLAARDSEGRLIPSSNYAYESLDFMKEIENSTKGFQLNLEGIDKRLEKVSRELGISKRDVLAMSQIDLDVAVKEKDVEPGLKPEEKDSKKIVLKKNEEERQEDEENREQNKDALENIQSKQEINLDRRIDDRYTLADVLDVPAGSKLLVVDSKIIENNENTTRFSPLLELPDGTIREIDCLTQVRW